MATLTRANQELFCRTPDECFDSFDALYRHCAGERETSEDRWIKPQELVLTHDLTVGIGDNPDLQLNDWSFSQLCRMAGVSKETINRLSLKTASKALQETLPSSEKPLQILTNGELIRSVHGVSYTRLWNLELLDLVKEFASDFTPPQESYLSYCSGLYCGQQDLFAFLIDPTGWVEIGGEEFAPGFFIWNSEVGRRSVGIQTFWYQSICQNHIVWDAVEVVEFTRKHTANVRDGLNEIRRLIEGLVAKRDARRDSFADVMRKALTCRLGDDAEEVAKRLGEEGIPRNLVKDAMKIAQQQGRFTIFSLVDALTRFTKDVKIAGDRTELDVKIGRLLALAMAA